MGFASNFFRSKYSKKTNKVESSSSSSSNTSYVCRDELDKKKSKIKKQVKFDLQPKYISQEEEISHEEDKKKNTSTSLEKSVDDNNAICNGVKVKILMRKEDAARLLLKCSEGGVLEFMDVAHELVSSSNVRVLSSPIHSSSNGTSLKAIPE
ncbi:hypothetical protein HAX54_040936 [Datura stramonium]|uniref:DUF7890 domain-containing protein n=1 Tax=Datura stramonium TaxID=4076 RepID=A0ABS8SKK7_DATST|nr:hypothetical protein [Datura stramonium]